MENIIKNKAIIIVDIILAVIMLCGGIYIINNGNLFAMDAVFKQHLFNIKIALFVITGITLLHAAVTIYLKGYSEKYALKAGITFQIIRIISLLYIIKKITQGQVGYKTFDNLMNFPFSYAYILFLAYSCAIVIYIVWVYFNKPANIAMDNNREQVPQEKNETVAQDIEYEQTINILETKEIKDIDAPVPCNQTSLQSESPVETLIQGVHDVNKDNTSDAGQVKRLLKTLVGKKKIVAVVAIMGCFIVGYLIYYCNPHNGTKVLKDGAKYTGTINKGKANGEGKLELSDGSKYIGTVKNDIIDGKGTLVEVDGTIYVGEFKNGEFNGNGVQKWPDGAIHIGTWTNGVREGYGIFTYPDGKKYEGSWGNDTMNGYGKIIAPGVTYEGYWRNGLKEGQGKLTVDGLYFTGSWRNDKMNGIMTVITTAGYKYICPFIDDVMDGLGTLWLPNGLVLSGRFYRFQYIGR